MRGVGHVEEEHVEATMRLIDRLYDRKKITKGDHESLFVTIAGLSMERIHLREKIVRQEQALACHTFHGRADNPAGGP